MATLSNPSPILSNPTPNQVRHVRAVPYRVVWPDAHGGRRLPRLEPIPERARQLRPVRLPLGPSWRSDVRLWHPFGGLVASKMRSKGCLAANLALARLNKGIPRRARVICQSFSDAIS